MRLPWFSQPPRRRRATTKSRRRTAAPLGVRRLERRRVLNASIETTPPQLDPAVPVAVDEGTLVTASATVDGSGPFTYAWTLSQGMTNVESGTDPTFAFNAPDDGLYQISVNVFDSETEPSAATVDIQINNVAPQLTDVLGDTIQENGTAKVTATIDDPGAFDVFSVDVNWLDGTSDTITGLGLADSNGTVGGTTYKWTAADRKLELSHKYLDDGANPGGGISSDKYDVQLIAHDDDMGTSDPQTATVEVNNALPKLTVPPDQMRVEGETLSFPGSDPVDQIVFTDVGSLDTHTAQINWGDGFTEPGVVTPFVGGGTISGSHTYADDGVYTVVVRVADDDMSGDFVNGVAGVDFVEQTFQVTVTNQNPLVVAPNGDQSIAEGGTVSFADLATFTDPGFDNPLNPTTPATGDPLAESFTYDIDWGDGQGAIVGMAIADMNGAAGILSSGTISGSHTYADDGMYVVKVTVHDDNGGSNFATFKVTVSNTPPALSVPPNQTRDEGQELVFPGSDPVDQIFFTDAGLLDTHTAQIDWGDGFVEPGVITPFVGGGTIDASHTYADDGVYTVVVRVADDDMSGDFVNGVAGVDFVEMTFTVTVKNVDPVVVVPHGNQSILEGATVSFSDLATFTDPGFDNPLNPTTPATGDPFNESFTYDIDWGDGRDAIVGMSVADMNGGPGVDSSGTISGSHTYADDGVYTVRVTVHDDNGGSHFATFEVTVSNVNPVVMVPHGNQMIVEGDTVSFSDLATFTDPGFDNTNNPNPPVLPDIADPKHESFTYDIDWGDGQSPIVGASIADLNGSPGVDSSGTISGSHTYADDGMYVVKVTVHDDNGGSNFATFKVTVSNTPPALSVPPNQTRDEGQELVFPGSDPVDQIFFTDAGLLDTHTAQIDWGDGFVEPGVITPFVGGGTIDASHTYADDGVYTVVVRVADDDMSGDFVNGVAGVDFVEKTFTVTVNNVDPVVVVPHGNQSILEGGIVSFTDLATFTDPGFDNPLNPTTPATGDPFNESFTYDIDWGDGRDAIVGASIVDLNGGPGVDSSGTISGSHTYADDGVYTVRVTVHDDNGGSHFQEFTVTVTNVNPVVVVPHGSQSILEGQTVSFSDLATFTDPGFDNPLNPTTPATGDPLNESFTYDIDWGDGRDAIVGASIADINGSPGVDSSGTIAGSHTYADDGVYTVRVTVHDDNGGSHFQEFTVTVANMNPVVVLPHGNQSILEGATVSFSDLATFTDPGFDNPLNPTTPATGDPLNESFTYDVDWGDGRDAILGASIVDLNGAAGVDSSGTIAGSHTFADNGVYTVRVTVHDDNGGVHFQEFTVTVTNVDPELTGTLNRQVNEGQAFTLTDLGIGITDPGFDNPLNTNMPPNGGEVAETFTSFNIVWGDGSANTPVTVVNRVSGSPSVATTAQFSHLAHTYADDGVYTVSITLQDDDGPVVAREFTITVNNVAPTLVVAPNQTVAESGDLVIATIGSFTDPGFDNPLNPITPASGDRFQESFTYDINWGDGRQELANIAVADTNGSPGVPSSGAFGGSHVYTDDGIYTVTVTIHDDNGGTTLQTFTVTVTNVNPSFVPVPSGASFEGDDVTSTGLTQIRVGFNDPGFDNTLNPNAPVLPNIGDPQHESFAHVIDWGDGTVDVIHTYANAGTYTITVTVNGSQVYTFANVNSSLQPVLTLVSGQTLFDPSVVPQLFTFQVSWGDGAVNTMQMMLALPGNPLLNTGRTTVFALQRASGGESTLTDGSFEVQHRYLGPPNPANPTADIPITVTVMDDNNGSVADTIAITNPGIDVVNVAIDTTPDVPRLLFNPQAAVVTFFGQQSNSNQGLQTQELRVARSELTVTADRYLELVVVYPDGTVSKGYRLKDEALQDLRGLFATLPDNRYRIYLVRTENNSRRLVMEVYVRNGRVIDPTDDSEGTRDRPPTSEQLQQPAAVPLEQNPLLEQPPAPGATDTNVPGKEQEVRDAQPARAEKVVEVTAVPVSVAEEPAAVAIAPETELPLSRSLRWAAPLAGLTLGAGISAWSQRVGDALEQADERAWQRLRRAGRLGWRTRKAHGDGRDLPAEATEYNKI